MMRPTPTARPAPSTLRVRAPEDFLALVPYLLGFHPEESVVALFSRAGRVLLTARVDLPALPAVGALAEHLTGLSVQHEADELVLAVYGADDGQVREVVERLVREVGVDVREAVRVSGGRWWSATCSGGCCPEEGTPYAPGDHPLAAEAVYAGLSAQPGRTELERQVSGPTTADLARLTALGRRARTRVARLAPRAAAALMQRTVRRCRDDPSGPTEADSLLLAVLASDLVVRDVAWAMMTREDIEADLRVWSATVARTPEELAPGPLGLFGVAAWISGQGALQNCCIERLQRIAPAYGLGVILDDISDRALSPRWWDEMVEDLRREVSAVAGVRLH